MTASSSTAAGRATDPRRRHAPATLPTSAAAAVAAPRSMARKARGSPVTGPCYPAAPAAGSRVPGCLFVELLEPGDELLDAGLVGEDLAGRGGLAAEQPVERGIEEEHRVRAKRAIRPAGLEEVDRRPGQAAQLDLAGDLLHELLALLLRGLHGRGQATS